MKNRVYAVIDLKSFYASVECAERGLDPMNTNLVVADSSRTEKTICLAVSPSLKKYGLSGRSRLFEVVQTVKKINAKRKQNAKNHTFIGKSYIDSELTSNPDLELDYIVAPPQMARYMDLSKKIYEVYKKYISDEDMVVYSIDEVFMDLTDYLPYYKLSAEELVRNVILDVVNTTGITATAGIGTNLFLAKVALDVEAKKIKPDKFGVRIAYLDEMLFRKSMWDHRPITDIWRVGRGYEKRLKSLGLYTLGDVAKCSVGKPNSYHNEELLYKTFGVNAELLIDHAWGYEPTTIKDIKGYRPETTSMTSGQVLHEAYTFEKARLIIREMVDLHVLDMVEKGLLTKQVVLTVGYDTENVEKGYSGEITTDHYGRAIPKHAHGTANLENYTSSTKLITDATIKLFDRIADKNLTVRRMYLVFNNLITESQFIANSKYTQLNLFDLDKDQNEIEKEKASLKKESSRQKAVLSIRKKYGKNALLKGMNFEEGATTKDRNSQIGGHKA